MANYEISSEYDEVKRHEKIPSANVEAQSTYQEKAAPYGLQNNEWQLYNGIVGKREILKGKQEQSGKSRQALEHLSEWTQSSDVKRTLESSKSNHKRKSEEINGLNEQYQSHKAELDAIESKITSHKRKENIGKIERDINAEEGILPIRQKIGDSEKFESELAEKRKNLEQLREEEDSYQASLKIKNPEAPEENDFAETGSVESVPTNSQSTQPSSEGQDPERDEISEHTRQADALMEKIKQARSL
ncbi:MAG: hypothetical protein Q8P07_00820 [bacterium]|nr:hypothetical protein [bacterium]